MASETKTAEWFLALDCEDNVCCISQNHGEAIEALSRLHDYERGRIEVLAPAALETVGRIAELEEVLGDLLSWFEGKPSDPEWRIKSGAYGADDAIQAAREAIAKVGGRS